MAQENTAYTWWQTGLVYQVYPRSFQDSNNDGIGDLQGIRQRLDYLQWLGVDAVWVSPIYPSPMADFGYDITDYCGIHPIFGTMQDLEELLTDLHTRGMKLILDLVPNHTSDEHPWFLESRSSRNNPKRDWYIWEDALEDGSAPSNWLSVFGGSAWQWDEHTEQYYYHAFHVKQPDLNWRNPEVQQAMFEVMRFWLDKGVDGFRVDVMWHMIKDKQLRNNPPNPNYNPLELPYRQLLPTYSTDQPEVHDLVRKMREITDSYENRLLIGEIYLPVSRLVAYYGSDNRGAHLPFNFQLISLPWQAEQLASAIAEYEGALPAGGWPNWVLSNHDKPRIASRVGKAQAKVAAMLLLTLRGTPTLYYGDELGMRDVPIHPNEVVDPQGLNLPGMNLSRDPARTPMQWNASEFAGFSKVRPWLRVAENHTRLNVEYQQQSTHSMLRLHRRLIKLRQQEPALHIGSYAHVYADHQLLAYTRTNHEQSFLIILNLSHRPAYFNPEHHTYSGTIEVSTYLEREGQPVQGVVLLNGDEGIVIRLNKS